MESPRLLPVLLLLLPLLHPSAESILCGTADQVVLQTKGQASAISLALVSNDQNTTGEVCSLSIYGPNVHSLSLRIIDVDNPFAEFNKTLPQKLFPKSRIGKKPSGKSNASQECLLDVFSIDEKESTTIPMWRIKPCSSQFSVAKMLPQLLLPPIKIEWWPPRSSQQTDNLRLIVTAINSGNTCLDSDQITCSRVRLEPAVCVSNALACDGVKHCPVGSGGDEATALCENKRSNWIEDLVKRILSKHSEFLDIEVMTTHSLHNSTKEPEKPKKETGKPRKGLSALDAALEPYGTWGYLMLGMLICATVLIIFGVWECFCHYSQAHPDQNMPPDCIAPAAIVCSGRPQHWRPYPPPTYEELEPPPPPYSALFPGGAKTTDTATTSIETVELATEPTESSVAT